MLRDLRDGQGDHRSFSSLTSSTSGRNDRTGSPEDGDGTRGLVSAGGTPEGARGRSNAGGRNERGAQVVTFTLPPASWDGSGGGAGSSDGRGGSSFPRSMGEGGLPGSLNYLDDDAAAHHSHTAGGALPALWNPVRAFDRVQYGRSFRFLVDGSDTKLNLSLTVNVRVPLKAYTEVTRSANFLWMVLKDPRGGPSARPRPNTALIGILERLEALRLLLRQHQLSPQPLPVDDGDGGGGSSDGGGGVSSPLFAILTTPGGRRAEGSAGTQGHSPAFIYGADIAATGLETGTSSPACAAQTIHQAEVAVTALALSGGVPDTVGMTFSFFALGFLFYLLRGGSSEDSGASYNGTAVRAVMRAAVLGGLDDAEYEEFAIAIVDYVMAKFGVQTLVQLCRHKVAVAGDGGGGEGTWRSDLYRLLHRLVKSDLVEPRVEEAEVAEAIVSAGVNPMLVRPQMACIYRRLQLMQGAHVQATHAAAAAGPTREIQVMLEGDDEDDDSDGRVVQVQVRHQSRLQETLDLLVCRRSSGPGRSRGAFFGLFPCPGEDDAVDKKRSASALVRKSGEAYDPYEKLEVSVMDNVAWTWGWLMKNEKTACFVIFMLIQYLALWAAGGFKIVEILFDSAVHSPDTMWMWTLIAIMVAGSVLSAQVKYVLDVANPSGAGFIPAMQVKMLRQLGRVRMEFLDLTSTTEIMNILENEIPRLSTNIDALIEGLSNLWQMIATLALCASISLSMTFAICCLLPFFAVLGYRVGKAVNKAAAELQICENKFKGEMNQNLSSNSTKKLLGLHDILDEELEYKKSDVDDAYDFLDTMMASQDRALNVLETALKLIVIIAGTLLVSTFQSGGSTEEEKAQARFLGIIPGMDVGNFVAFYMASETVGGFIVEISKSYRTFSTTAVALEMFLMLEYKLLDDVAEAPRVIDRPPLLEATAVNFVFRPPGGGDILKAPLLFRNLNLVVEPGMKVGIVGKSGSGKSTLCKLLSRLYNPTAGTITVTGTNLRELDLFSTIATMEQETLLFKDSVYGNLVVGTQGLSMERIEFCCKAANVHVDILDLEGGYQFQVGVMGRMLSGGQRQRIAIARALLRNTSVVILDEPTSAQEPGVTVQIGRNLSKWQYTAGDGQKHPATVLAVTHNYPLVDEWDLMMVFQGGSIVEYDTKATLLARKGRLYRMMNSTNGLMVDGMGRAIISPERLAQIWLFASPEIPTEELQLIADACQTRHVSAGETLYRYDDEADAMYLVVQGQCQDAKHLQEGSVEMAHPRMWDVGDVVGELNLLPDNPKPWGTDATAKSRAILLHLPKALFAEKLAEGEDGAAPALPVVREVVRELSYQVASTRSAGRLDLVWPFCGVDQSRLKTLGDLMDIVVEEPESVIFNAPDKECDAVYFVLRGRVALSRLKRADGGKQREVTSVFEGGMQFGEESLLFGSSRMRHAKTLEQSIILTMDRVMFTRYVGMVRAEAGDTAADDITQNLTSYRSYTSNPSTLPLAMWPLAMLSAEQLAHIPGLMRVSAHGEGSQVCVIKESDDEAHIILRGCVAVQIMRSESITVSKELRLGDVVNAVTLAGDAGRFGELVLSAECTEPTVLLTLSRSRLWQVPEVDPALIATVALHRHLMTTLDNLNNIGLGFLAVKGKIAALRELVDTRVYTKDKVVVDAGNTTDAYLVLVAHGLVSVVTAADKGNGTPQPQVVKPGQYVVTTGPTQPAAAAPGVVMVRGAATVTAASPYAVVIVMAMGRVSVEAEAEQRRMEEKLLIQEAERKLYKVRLATRTVLVRAMELQLGVVHPQHPRARWRKALRRIRMLITFGIKDALSAGGQSLGGSLSAEAAGSLQVELARLEQRLAMLQRDLDERRGRLQKLEARWEEIGVLEGEDPTGGGVFAAVECAVDEEASITLTASQALALPGLVPTSRQGPGPLRPASGRGTLRPASGREPSTPGGAPRLESRARSDSGHDDNNVMSSFSKGEGSTGLGLTDRYVRRRLQKVPLTRRDYPQPGDDATVGHWMIMDVEDTKKPAASPPTVTGRWSRAGERENTMHKIYIFNPELSSERLVEMSRAMDEKERSRKSTRDTELMRLDKLLRRDIGNDDESQRSTSSAIGTKARSTLDALRELGYGLTAFTAIRTALAEERKMLVPHYRSTAARVSELWAHLKVPPSSRMKFRLTALDTEVDEFLLEKLDTELARLEDVSALLLPLFAEQHTQEGQVLDFDQAYLRLQRSLQLMKDAVPTPESCMESGIDPLREAAAAASAECAQRQEQMSTAAAAIRNFWIVLSVSVLEQISFDDTDLSLLSLAQVRAHLAELEQLAERRSLQRDRLVISLTEAWRILNTPSDVHERVLKAHIGLQPQVLGGLQAERNKVNTVVKEYKAREEIVSRLEPLWAKLRFPSGETRWARECLHYHVRESREILEREVVRLEALLKLERRATQAHITSAAGSLAKIETEIIRLQKLGYQYQVESTGLAVAAASVRVKEFTAIEMALAAPVTVHLRVLNSSMQCNIAVKEEVRLMEANATRIQALFRRKLARRKFVAMKQAMTASLSEDPENVQPIPGGVGLGAGRTSTAGGTSASLDAEARATLYIEVTANEKLEVEEIAREERRKREMISMNAAVAEIKAIYRELKIPEAEITERLRESSTDSSGGGASVGATLSAITEEIEVAKSRMGIRDGIKALQSKLPKMWKRNGVDGEAVLLRLSLAVTRPIDVKVNVDAEIDAMTLMGKCRKFYGNKKKVNMPEVPIAIVKHIVNMSPLERQAVLHVEMAFVKLAESAEKLMKKAKVAQAEMSGRVRRCAFNGVGEAKLEAIRQLIVATEAEIDNQRKRRLKDEETAAKKADKSVKKSSKKRGMSGRVTPMGTAGGEGTAVEQEALNEPEELEAPDEPNEPEDTDEDDADEDDGDGGDIEKEGGDGDGDDGDGSGGSGGGGSDDGDDDGSDESANETATEMDITGIVASHPDVADTGDGTGNPSASGQAPMLAPA